MPGLSDQTTPARAATARGGRESARMGGGRALPVLTHARMHPQPDFPCATPSQWSGR